MNALLEFGETLEGQGKGIHKDLAAGETRLAGLVPEPVLLPAEPPWGRQCHTEGYSGPGNGSAAPTGYIPATIRLKAFLTVTVEKLQGYPNTQQPPSGTSCQEGPNQEDPFPGALVFGAARIKYPRNAFSHSSGDQESETKESPPAPSHGS